MSYATGSDGTPVAKPNAAGIEHYRQVLNALGASRVAVALTMWHWDTPAALENWASTAKECIVEGQTTGSFWLCPQSAVYFREYAEVLLREFGPLVQFWITLNEPLTLVQNGYSGSGPHAPGRCSNREQCWHGDDAIEPFVVAHNLLRSHAMAFSVWKSSSARLGTSSCGVTLNGDFALPVDPTSQVGRRM